MKTNTPSLQDQRRRKFLLVMPAIVFCFATLLFWALGGGRNDQAKAATTKGLNMKLPSAIIAADQTGDKMSFYDQAHADSLKKQQLRKADPYTQNNPDSLNRLSGANPGSTFSSRPSTFEGVEYGGINSTPAENEARINQRLAQLQAVVNKPLPVSQQVKKPVNTTPDLQLKPTTAAEDPEMKQMNDMLEKILDIQHPDRLKNPAKDSINHSKRFRAIPAVIDGNQKVTQGTVVRIKLLDTVTLNGRLIPKGQLLYGSGSLYNQRMGLNIRIIHIGYEIIPVDLTVFDMVDGLEGICVPEAVTGDAVKEGADNGVENMELMSMDESMGAQAAAAGINAAKGLFSKKIKRVKGKLKGGHLLLLRDNIKAKNNH